MKNIVCILFSQPPISSSPLQFPNLQMLDRQKFGPNSFPFHACAERLLQKPRKGHSAAPEVVKNALPDMEQKALFEMPLHGSNPDTLCHKGDSQNANPSPPPPRSAILSVSPSPGAVRLTDYQLLLVPWSFWRSTENNKKKLTGCIRKDLDFCPSEKKTEERQGGKGFGVLPRPLQERKKSKCPMVALLGEEKKSPQQQPQPQTPYEP